MRNEEYTGSSTLFSQYIQDGMDLLLSVFISNVKGESIENVREIIGEMDEVMEDWVEALINSGYIMNYFCREASLLTNEMKRELFSNIKITN